MVNSSNQQQSVRKQGNHGKQGKTGIDSCVDFMCSLRSKTLFTLFFLFLLMILCVLAVLLAVFIPGFAEVENKTIRDATKRVMTVLYDDFNNMVRVSLTSFGAWDETYALVDQTYSDQSSYMDDNFPPTIMKNLQLSFAAIYNLNGQLQIYRSYDLEHNTYDAWTYPEQLHNLSSSNPFYSNAIKDENSKYAGLLIDNNRILFVTVVPIITSAFTGPPKGLFLFARYQSHSYVADIAARAQVCLSLHPVTVTNDDVVAKLSSAKLISNTTAATPKVDDDSWVNVSPVLIQQLQPGTVYTGRQCWQSEPDNTTGSPLEEARLASYSTVNDYLGHAAYVARADTNRNVYSLSISAIGIGVGVVCAISIVVSIVIQLFMECCVLRPMVLVSKSVLNVSDEVSERVPKQLVSSRSEIENLTNNINIFLTNLQAAKKALVEEERKLQRYVNRISSVEDRSKAIMNSIPDFIITIDALGLIKNCNLSVQNILNVNVLSNWNINRVLPNLKLEEIKELAKNPKNTETEAHSAVGEKFHVKVFVTQATFVDDKTIDNAEFDGWVILARNISDLKRFEQSLKKEQEKATQLKLSIAFDTMMRTPDQREQYKEFCKKQHTEENMLFLEAVENYRSTTMAHERVAKQQEITTKFLSSDSGYQLNVASSTAKNEIESIRNGIGQRDLFNRLEQVIRKEMMIDSFARYHATNTSL